MKIHNKIAVALIALLSTEVANSQTLIVPAINQNDSQWTKKFPDGDTIKHVGCTVCCICMLHRYYGDNIDPNQTLTWLVDHHGITTGQKSDLENDLIIWTSSSFSGVNYERSTPKSWNAQDVDSELSKGYPVIAQVVFPGPKKGAHYVVLTGKLGSNYSISDPEGRTTLTPFYGSTAQNAVKKVIYYHGANPKVPFTKPAPAAPVTSKPVPNTSLNPPRKDPPKLIEKLKYSVTINVSPGSKDGEGAWVTFYGIENFYRHVQVTGKNHSITFSNVPGGPGVKVRIDVDLKNKKHHEYYNQDISGNGKAITFTYKP